LGAICRGVLGAPRHANEAIVANQDRFAGGDVGGNDSGDSVDAEAIFQSIGEVPYEWRIDSDELSWGPNAGTVLAIADPATIGSGRSFAQLVDPKSGRRASTR
jgi:hypothetical protein